MRRLKIALFFLLGWYSCESFAILPIVYDPYDVFQNTITAKNSVQALINQAKQLQFEIENFKKLSKGNFENTDFVLNQLSSLASQGHALSYGLKNVDKTFTQRFPGLEPTNDFNQDYAKWSSTAFDTLKNAMAAMSFQGQLFNQENDHIKTLQMLSDNVQGNLSAQQASHRIALQEISQLQKLRQLMLVQGSTQNTLMAYQLQKEQSQQAAMHQWIQNSQLNFRQYKGNSGFGANELPNLP